jgi:CBS domain containing-hemolysin-like protein
VEQLAEQGDRRARSTLAAVRSLSFQLSGAQLGITVTSLVVGFVTEPTIATALEPVAVDLGLPEGSSHAASIVIALALVTTAEMIIGELVPKNVAISKPLSVALRIATPLRWLNRAVKAVIVWLNGAANWTVKSLGIDPREELAGIRSLEELQMLVQSARAAGAIPDEDASLLTRSLSFGGKTAADALVPRTSVHALPRDATIADLARLARDTGHSRFPVYAAQLDDVIGVAHVKDGYAVAYPERAATSVAEIMRPAMIVPESRKLEPLLVEMRRERHHLAVVVDEYGGTGGIITLEDVLEEIVGDIEDEHDLSRPPPTAPTSGIHVVSGMLHPDEVREATGLDVPEGDYETLAGFLLTRFDRIPELGDHTSHGGWELKVVEMDRRRIARVLLVAPPRPHRERGPQR